MMPSMIGKLNKKYFDGETIDSKTFSEQRSNILLDIGNHYSKKTSKHIQRLRSSGKISNEAKIRITKNHIQKITKSYINEIINAAPMVAIMPRNNAELQDQKKAEMYGGIWNFIKDENDMQEKIQDYVSDLVVIGELFVKVYWDAEKGTPIPIEEKIDPETGEVVELIQMMSGQLAYEKISGFNVLRDPAAETLDESRWIITRKMVDKNDLLSKYADDEKKQGYISQSGKGTYTVFNGNSNTYDESKNKVNVREYYFRPSSKYPKGYFYIATEVGVLEEGPLPLGLFPIVYCGFDRLPTSPRSQSIIKQLRPYQAEINRAASKMAEHHVTLGDDKVFIQAGTKIVQGGTIAGIRGVQYTGQIPTILQGRSGAQYLDYMNSQITEMYNIANLVEDKQEKNANLDPYSMLFRSMRDKKKFSIYAEKFERFLKKLCMLSLKLFKFHAPVQMAIPMVGRNEIVNLEELKSDDDLSFEIKVEPRTNDIETQMGKQLTMNHVLQYAAGQLDPSQIGQVIRQMPMSNSEDVTSELTIDYDVAKNTMLSLERGQYIPANRYDNHVYMIRKLVHRTRQPEFRILDPQIQQMYQAKIQEHEQIQAQIVAEQQAMKDGFIPSGGYLVEVGVYITVPNSTGGTKTVRARIPYESVNWLIERLNAQGSTQDVLQQVGNAGAIGEIGNAARQVQMGVPQTQLQ